jgi:ubiquitin C-terminal hydrolase
MNPLFEGIAAGDSKDVILFILETIHRELNTKKSLVPI